MRIWHLLHLLCFAILVAVPCHAPAAAQPADTIFFGGPVLTMDDAGTVAAAVAVRGERIIAVGSEADVRAHAGRETRWIDLDGRALLPGFIDAHGHFPSSGLIEVHFVDLNSPPIGEVRGIDDIVARLAAKAAATPDGQWVQGRGYDDTLIAEMRHPTRDDLDRASTRHPIYISHISGHVFVANSLALTMAGITAETPDPFGGVIRRDPVTRIPTGVLEEPPAALAVTALLPKFAPSDLEEAAARAAAAYAALGVTTAQNGAAGPGAAEPLLMARNSGRLPIRVHVWPLIQSALSTLAHGRMLDPLGADGWIDIKALKGFADGSIQAYTGYLSQPYHSHTHPDPDYRGYPRQKRDDLARQVLAVHKAGYQLAIHGNGDAAIDDILDAIAKAQETAPRADARHIVVHAQMAREDQLERMAALGVIPSFFNLHTYYWGDRHRDIFMGPTRAARMSPARSALDRGLRFTLHADTPVVPMDPLRIVWAAVNRLTSSGQVIGADQRIPVLDALRGITTHAAYQAFEENEKGAIAPGMLADLVVLDRNPLTADPLTLKDIVVRRTVVGGRTVYVRR